ncbi:hypothetical protein, partial [Clostridium sp. UBA6640]|uniref:hypothetical protein n=1 Tax=Clostridium sp. UBA6640 TaxID=1946370 RepID=UPI0025BECD7D
TMFAATKFSSIPKVQYGMKDNYNIKEYLNNIAYLHEFSAISLIFLQTMLHPRGTLKGFTTVPQGWNLIHSSQCAIHNCGYFSAGAEKFRID